MPNFVATQPAPEDDEPQEQTPPEPLYPAPDPKHYAAPAPEYQRPQMKPADVADYLRREGVTDDVLRTALAAWGIAGTAERLGLTPAHLRNHCHTRGVTLPKVGQRSSGRAPNGFNLGKFGPDPQPLSVPDLYQRLGLPLPDASRTVKSGASKASKREAASASSWSALNNDPNPLASAREELRRRIASIRAREVDVQAEIHRLASDRVALEAALRALDAPRTAPSR